MEYYVSALYMKCASDVVLRNMFVLFVLLNRI